MLNKVKTFIEKHQLLNHDDRYIVALSGGADSVCLLLMLQELQYHIEAAHCNFHLRGNESDSDEKFVIELCKKLDIPLHLIHFDTKTYAELHQVSIEMAARELRYRYFEQLRTDIDAAGVCVAHHQDDSVETILMNLLRGTGIQGLCGIQPVRERIIRPLLCLSRQEIESWLAEKHQSFVTDSTNLSADILRNHLRLKVIPLLKEMTPAAVEQILTSARRLKEASKVYDAGIKEALNRLIFNDSIDVNQLLQEPSPESILYEWLSPCGFNPSVIESISDGLREVQAGRYWQSATHILTVNKGALLLAPIPEERPTLRIPENGYYAYGQTEHFRIKTASESIILRERTACSLDADKVAFPLVVRPIRNGDRFHPLGMNGSKLVSDYLTDRKMSIIERRHQLVVTDAHDQIIWLVGERPDNDFRVETHTARTLIIEYIKD